MTVPGSDCFENTINSCISRVLIADLRFDLRDFAPFFRASERPMAIACLRIFTLPP